MKKFMLMLFVTLASSPALPMGDDDPLVVMGGFDQLEYAAGDGESGAAWDMHFWIGKDIDKFRFSSDGEYRGGTTVGFFRTVYSRSLLPFWDLTGGWRREFGGGEQWDAATIEIIGTLPQNVFTEASLSAGERGQTQLWGRFEYMVNFNSRSPRWLLIPELEFSLFGKDDPATGTGSGLSDIELGLRLHRQFRPDLSPYIGANWSKQFGATADFSRSSGQDTSELQWVIGLQFWF
jgi:copper resistance protein B